MPRFSRRARDQRQKSKRASYRPQVERLENRRLLTATPYGATLPDSSEVMLGSVLITPVFFESDGSQDANLEDWTPTQITDTKAKIEDAMAWWVQTLANQGSVHGLDFVYDFTHANTPFQTKYEPIARISNDFELYANDFLDAVGFGTPSSSVQDIQGFNNAQREKFGTNWSFTMFVVNSANDLDGMFKSGGIFNQAFAIPSRFMVVPSERPMRTYTHEAGHIFWGLDEYTGGGTYSEHRGYYDTQNLNAVEGNVPGFVQEDSIMAAGTAYFDAFNNHTSAASTLAIIGWQDSDNDGVFDLLDVPHSLSVSASYDSVTGAIQILGDAKVRTLPNQNTEGEKSDITLNRIDALQYRLDQGDWMTAATYGTYEATMNVSTSGNTGATAMDVRTVSIDSITGLVVTTSDVFTVQANSPASNALSGIAGHVFQDADSDGQHDRKEVGLSGREVRLVDNAGQTLVTQTTVEPDGFANGTTLTPELLDGVTLTAGGLSAKGDVLANISTTNPTGGQVFVFDGFGRIETEWQEFSGELIATFDSPTGMVQLDAIASNNGEVARMEAFDAGGNSLGRFTTPVMSAGDRVTMTLADADVTIASIKAFGRVGHNVHLDSLVFGVPSSTFTDAMGNFAFSYLPTGDYQVMLNVGETVSLPVSGTYDVSLLAGDVRSGNDFGVVFDRPWQNPNSPADVNADNVLTTTDLVNLVGDIFLNGPRDLAQPTDAVGPPLFFDINADSRFSVADLAALLQQLLLKTGGGSEPPGPEIQSSRRDVAQASRSASGSFEIRVSSEPSDLNTAGQVASKTPDVLSNEDSEIRKFDELLIDGPVLRETNLTSAMLDEAMWDEAIVSSPRLFTRTLGYSPTPHRIGERLERRDSNRLARSEKSLAKDRAAELDWTVDWTMDAALDEWLLDLIAVGQAEESESGDSESGDSESGDSQFGDSESGDNKSAGENPFADDSRLVEPADEQGQAGGR